MLVIDILLNTRCCHKCYILNRLCKIAKHHKLQQSNPDWRREYTASYVLFSILRRWSIPPVFYSISSNHNNYLQLVITDQNCCIIYNLFTNICNFFVAVSLKIGYLDGVEGYTSVDIMIREYH